MARLSGHKDASLVEVDAVDEGHSGGLYLVLGKQLLQVNLSHNFFLLNPPMHQLAVISSR